MKLNNLKKNGLMLNSPQRNQELPQSKEIRVTQESSVNMRSSILMI